MLFKPFLRLCLRLRLHGTVNENEWYARNFLFKSLLNSACLRSKLRLAINKKQKYFSLPDHKLSKNTIYFGLYERTEKGLKPACQVIGIKVIIIFT